MQILTAIFLVFIVTGCQYQNTQQLNVTKQSNQINDTVNNVEAKDTTVNVQVKKTLTPTDTNRQINTGRTKPAELLAFAKTLIGIPYKYGSTDPAGGFDCSGFITYVFNHFNIAVPRSSIDFTNYQTKVDLAEARPGDIILFTGTDSTLREVGHMGIITTANNSQIEFIHSTSGKANGVTITALNSYYMGRFVKVLRVFNQ